MRISFIGGGNMAKAIISGLKANGFAMSAITVIEPDAAKRESLSLEFGIHATEDLHHATHAEAIVLAMKPQQLRELCLTLGNRLASQLVVSIAAGIRTTDLSRWLGGYQAIVRVMPNTPAQIQQGVSALFAMPKVSHEQKLQSEEILKAVGSTLWVDEEVKLDAVTAISGSGPAYVFYFIEALQQAAIELGLSEDEAKQLSTQTFIGSSLLASISKETPATLRAQVTSKGGTTEQAILTMNTHQVQSAIIAAAKAAAEKSATLGDLLGKD